MMIIFARLGIRRREIQVIKGHKTTYDNSPTERNLLEIQHSTAVVDDDYKFN